MKYGIKEQTTEREIVDAVDALLRKSGYRILPQLRIRTWRPDLVGVKDDEVVIVEAKGHRSDMKKALAQTALYSTDATSAYLALPMERIQKGIKKTAEVLGIGLIGVDEAARIVVEASRSKPRPYLVRRIRRTRNVQPPSSGLPRRTSAPAIDRLLRHRRVIDVLISRPARRFTIRELSQEAKTAYSTTWRLVRDLDSLGVVISERFGTSRVLNLNPQSPIVTELKRLSSLELAPHRLAARDFAQQLTGVPEVRQAILFGSVAKRSEAATSDVDIAIVIERKDDSVLDRIDGIAEDVQDRTRMRIVPLFVSPSERKAETRIAKAIRSGEVLFERS